MAPNKRGGSLSAAALRQAGVISAEEVAARGSGTCEEEDSYVAGVRSEMRVFFTGLMFLTRLPCPGWCDHHPAYLMRSMAYFPLFGAIIGAWGATFHAAVSALLPRALAAAASTLATVWLTGAFHEDGLADVFDGFGGGWGRAQILRIMKDSRVGTYALVGVSLALHAKLHALAALPAADVCAALVAVHAASRWSCAPLVYCCRYLQDEEDAKAGLYNWFAASRRLLTPPRLLISTAVAAVLPLVLLGPVRGAGVLVAVVAVTACAGWYGTLVLGGVVGDFLGATIQVAELAAYVALLADWSVLADASTGAWRPLVTLAAVVALPVAYSRRIVDFGGAGTADC